MSKRKAERINKKDSARIEKAAYFLSEKYAKSGINKKPVVLHSLRVAFDLLRAGAETDVVIVAILHDLLEDSAVDFRAIEKLFGTKIALGVLSLSENNKIKEYEKRYKEGFERTLKEGEDAVLVRLADMYDNSFYISLEKDIKKQRLVLDKISYFLEVTKGTKNNMMHEMLEKRYKQEKARIDKKK